METRYFIIKMLHRLLVQSVRNAMKKTCGTNDIENTIHVMHVIGTKEVNIAPSFFIPHNYFKLFLKL